MVAADAFGYGAYSRAILLGKLQRLFGSVASLVAPATLLDCTGLDFHSAMNCWRERLHDGIDFVAGPCRHGSEIPVAPVILRPLRALGSRGPREEGSVSLVPVLPDSVG